MTNQTAMQNAFEDAGYKPPRTPAQTLKRMHHEAAD